ncbi:hypothetical protein PsYK624_099690 [Phanerochaete sordida]|uniref:Carrier domain-containing protein n=1 Tax=Phanerochaete sordida TaxID=48140 RepID=A0A9P3LH67_9APHY|nr:hypothetical protein PsYK624_099690 [Phanerochaete sordida]
MGDLLTKSTTSTPASEGIEALRGCVPVEFAADHLLEHRNFELNATATATLEGQLYGDLVAFSQRTSATPHEILLAAIRILHLRYSGASRAVIALSSAGQEPLAVLIEVEDQDTFADIIRITHEIVSSLDQHGHPYSAVEQQLAKNRSGAAGSAVPLLVRLDDAPTAPAAKSSFPMEWRACQSHAQLRVDVRFDAARFGPDTVAALLANLADVIAAAVAAPEHTVDDIPFSHALAQLTAAHIPVAPAPAPPAPRPTLAQAFAAAAAAHHDQPALIDGALTLTYREADVLASALAARLRAAAAQQEALAFVALCIPPGALAVLAVLAVAKSGAAYVPLDVRFPARRLAELVADSGAALVVSAADAPAFEFDRERVAHLDVTDFLKDYKALLAGGAHARDGSASPVSPAESSDDPAYVFYTSGSTGKPKGVLVKQASVVAFASNRDVFTWGPGDRIAQLNNPAWDASVLDVWGALLSGAALVCVDRYTALDPPALAKVLVESRVDACFMTTSLFRHVLDAAPHAFGSLRLLLVGGEGLFFESVRRLRAAAPSLTFYNVYGTTETCVFSCGVRFLPGDDIPSTGPVPIGHPFATSQKLVVDRAGRLVPPGAVGELVIGGEGVALGYLNRAEETARAFVRLDIPGLPGNTRFYRTGDAVRWRDGQLHFVGRMNAGQVKIRGQRLELGEVESTLVRSGLVASAAVSYHKPAGADASLVAYVVLDRLEKGGEQAKEEGADAVTKVMDTWKNMYDDMYSKHDLAKQRAEFIGWDSMITGEPIPKNEMTAWLHDTLRPFLEQRPRTVFEIGCGTGIFVHQILPSVERMWAIEPSEEAVHGMNAELRELGLDGKLAVWQATADRIPALPSFEPEFVLMNSVVQYFPSEAYLQQVIADTAARCVPGARILVGDVRSLPLDSLLGIAILTHGWQGDLASRSLHDLCRGLLKRDQNRSELLVDPAFFTGLRRAIPAISHVEVVPKAIEFCNELSQFRYQVVLHVNAELPLVVPEQWHDYEALQWQEADLEDALRDFATGDETALAVERIPNRFLSWESAAAATVFAPSADQFATLASVLPPRKSSAVGWSAFDLERLAEDYGVTVKLSVARQSETTTIDAVFVKAPLGPGTYVAFKTAEPGAAALAPCAASRLKDRVVEARPEDGILEQLRAVLPSYMVPDRIFSVSSLPLLTSGKLDRRKLAAMAESDAKRAVRPAAADAEATPPADDVEARLCAIYGELLGREAVSPLADFFNIGGHSLLATRLKSSLEAEFHISLLVKTIFSHPSPRELASVVRELRASAPVAHKPSALAAAPADGEYYPLSFAQDRMWFLQQLANYSSQDISYNSPYLLKLDGRVKPEVLERTLQEIVLRHEVLRTVFVEIAHEPKTLVVDFHPQLEVVPVEPTLDEPAVKALIRESARRRFALGMEPSFRATLFQMTPERSYLLLCMHHAVVDGYSLDIIQNEMVELYPAYEASRDHTLPPLPIQYKEYARWQRSEEFERMLKPQIDYWTEHLAGSKAMEWPTDFERPPQLTQEAKTVLTLFPIERFALLEQICKEERVTMFMLMASVFRIVHFQLTGEADAAFVYPIANRNRPETENLIGFFVNTQILRLNVRPGMPFLELLQQARDLSWAAYEHQDLPFERIVAIQNPTRDLGYVPLAQIIFAYQSHKSAPFSLGNDVRASIPHVDLNLTRFDLEAYFHPRADGLHGEFFYSVDLYREETIVNLTNQIHAVLDRVIEDRHFFVHPPQSLDHELTPRADPATYLQDYMPSQFPLDFPRRPEQSVHSFALPPAVCDALRTSTQDENELLALYYAAMAVLNHRYSGSEDITIGLTTSESLDVVPARVTIHRDNILSQVLDDARRSVKKASEFSHLSILDVAAVVKKPAVVRVVVSKGGHASSKYREHSFDLELLYPDVDASSCQLVYNPAVFRSTSVQAFSENLLDVLESLLLCPALPVEEIPFRNALKQLKQLGLPLTATRPPPSPSYSLVDAFNKSVEAYPDQIAIEDGRLKLTFRELDIVTTLLARKISQTSGGAEDFIATCIPPSALTVISILSIIKAGAAYVPLDVRYPQERLKLLLNASGARLLIMSSSSPDLADAAEDVTCLDISNFLAETELVPPADLSPLRRQNIAYLMYTSGSTGMPKGVPVTQSSVIAFASNTDLLAVEAGDRVGMVNNTAWDVSVLDIWCPLLLGATIVCFNRYDILDLAVLAGQFAHAGITAAFLSPALFRQALNIAPQLFRSLRVLQIGGEASYYEGLQRVRAVKPEIIIRNLYGPTEACVSVVISSVEVTNMPAFGPVPIGRPLATTQALIVDTKGRLVPPGIIGELIVGGASIGPGYLRRPKETAEAFVERAYEGVTNGPARFYRTGDAVQWRPDGQMYFLGRMNAGQIKIRGQRLELAEVENAIIRTGLAYDAAVVHLKSDKDESDVLAAYAVAASPLAPHETEARSTLVLDILRRTMPSFAVPFLLRWLPTLPVSPNGKVDRRVLLSRAGVDVASAQRNDTDRSRGEPVDETEARLCRIMETVLGCEAVGRSENFFNAGGHSLLAPRLAFRVQDAFGVPFTLMDVFNRPTPKAMAEKIRQLLADAPIGHRTSNGDAKGTEDFIITPALIFSNEPGRPFLFCVPMFTGLGFSFAPLSRSMDRFNVVAMNDPHYIALDDFPPDSPSASYAATLRTPDGHTVPNQAQYYYALILEEIARLGAPLDAPLNILGYSYGGHVAMEVARLAQDAGRVVHLFVLDSAAHAVRAMDEAQARADAGTILAMGTRIVGGGDAGGALGERMRAEIEERSVVNFRTLCEHEVRPYNGRMTLFRTEANADHGFAEFVDELDEIVLHGNHYRLLEEASGNLPLIAGKIGAVAGV